MFARRFPIGLLLVAPVALGFGVYAFTGQAQVPDPDATPTTDSDATATQTPFWDDFRTQLAESSTEQAEFPTPFSPPALETPAPGPAAQRGDFHEGAWVRVNAGEGDCLNARNQPSLENEWVIVNTCLPHGSEGYISGEAQYGDGRWWWFIAGSGWVAEEFLEYAGEIDIRARTLPELSGKGMIAFTRQGADYRNDLWVMNADGTGQRMIRRGADGEYPQNLGWSPDGTRLVFGLPRADGTDYGTWDVHIVPVDIPAAEVVIENAFGANWSSDGARFATVLDPKVDPMGGGVKGIPALVDVVSGSRTSLSQSAFFQQSAPSFNDDGTKLVLTYADYSENAADPGPRIMVWDLAGNEIARINPPEGAYYGRPTWSPVADQLEFHAGTTSQGQPQYVVYDLARHDIIAGARVPAASNKIGGRCGGWNMWTAAWSRDGSHVLYSFDSGETGANGIWTWDVATGAQTLVPAIYASSASPGPAGYAVFSSSGGADAYIFIASPAGGFPTLLTDGWNPVWGP